MKQFQIHVKQYNRGVDASSVVTTNQMPVPRFHIGSKGISSQIPPEPSLPSFDSMPKAAFDPVVSSQLTT